MSIGDVFDEAGTEFARLTPIVWGPAGQALTFQLEVAPGESVLDVCCGGGASALPAAAAVGPNGRVHAIDLSDDLLEHGRVLASERGLQNIDFVQADATQWEAPSDLHTSGYDVLSCSYGVFFLPHMNSDFARLVALVRPGGRVGVTVWRRGALIEFMDAFLAAVGEFRPEYSVPQDRPNILAPLDTPDGLRSWLEAAGTVSPEVRELSNLIPATPEFAWDFACGGRLRSALLGVGPDVVESIRLRFLDLLVEREVHTIDAGTLIGTAVAVGPNPT